MRLLGGNCKCAAKSAPNWWVARAKKNGDAFRRRRLFCLETNRRRLAEVVRNVVEGRVQLVADALHRCNSGNGNERGDQAVLDRGRTLRILNQVQKFGHLWSPIDPTPRVCSRGSVQEAEFGAQRFKNR